MMIANFQREHAKISARANACIAQNNGMAQQRAYWASQGRVIGLPPCMSYMAQWTARLAFLENQIYRWQNNDPYTDPCKLNGFNVGCTGRDRY
jgi:hypothetical protein